MSVYASKIRTYDPVRKLEKINNFKIESDAFKNSKKLIIIHLLNYQMDEYGNDVVYNQVYLMMMEKFLSEDYVLPALDAVLNDSCRIIK